ncbi:MAG: S1 family peptidase [Deltaproteobacteria bacterium]|nr:S1 family peptidase [Deltaproteobacteria bacterium]
MGCSSERGMYDEVLGTQTDAIVGGSADITHQAAVAYMHGSKCTATIIHMSGSTGYALTAGHCVGGALGTLRQGNNYNNADAVYTVTDATRHPLYSGTPSAGKSRLYDFGMLTFSGATGSTPIMDALPPSQDSLAQGHNLDIVGYGNTVDPNSGGTTVRRHIVKPLAQVHDLRLVFNQASTGMCSGDSGGPAVRNAGQDYVAGVNSYISNCPNECVGNNCWGTAVRVSAVYDTFIMPYINNTPYLDQTCDQCEEAHVFAGDCTSYVEACWNNTACSNYIDCINNCSTQSCYNQCAATHSSGYAVYQQIYNCVCTTACVTECAADPLCAPPPPCGFTSPNNPQCQNCWEQNCCDEGNDCAADPYCVECITSITPPSGCASDPEAMAFKGCLLDQCADPCNLGGEGGAGGEGGGGTGGASSTSTSTSTSGVGGSTSTSGVGGESSSGQPAEFTVDQGGCGCATPGERRLGSSLWLLALGLAAAAARRRR